MSQSESPEVQIQELFDDHRLFARLAASVNVRNFRYTYIFYHFGHPALSFLFFEKGEIRTIQEAFAVGFILDLTMQHEWIEDESLRTSPEQVVSPTPGLTEWKNILQDRWIKLSFSSGNAFPLARCVDGEVFAGDLLAWVPENLPPDALNKITLEVGRTQWVCELFRSRRNQLYFGATEAGYLLGGSGIYDACVAGYGRWVTG